MISFLSFVFGMLGDRMNRSMADYRNSRPRARRSTPPLTATPMAICKAVVPYRNNYHAFGIVEGLCEGNRGRLVRYSVRGKDDEA